MATENPCLFIGAACGFFCFFIIAIIMQILSSSALFYAREVNIDGVETVRLEWEKAFITEVYQVNSGSKCNNGDLALLTMPWYGEVESCKVNGYFNKRPCSEITGKNKRKTRIPGFPMV